MSDDYRNVESTNAAQLSSKHSIDEASRTGQKNRSALLSCIFTSFFLMASPAYASLDDSLSGIFEPIAKAFTEFFFYSINIGGADLPLIVVWLIVGALYFTVYFRFITLRGFTHALRIVAGKEDNDPKAEGEVSHFQALTAAVSGTVGVGNVVHVAVAISIGGPGATFWMIVAGFLGMSSKFLECTLGTKYRVTNADGSVSGGPMYYMKRGFAELGFPKIGKGLAWYYAAFLVLVCLGGGCMFQANQAYVQFASVTGGADSFFGSRAWLFGIIIAILTAFVIVGGIKSIAKFTSKLVPFMALLYLGMAITVIVANWSSVPAALLSIVTNAFNPDGLTGGFFAVLILGFRRAAFSNDAGNGSAAIAHSAVRTNEPLSQGFVAMLEPFIDTVVICTLTALVIILTVYDPVMLSDDTISGVELTSSAFGSVVSWFPEALAVVIILFAFSTMITWSYYGLAGFTYVFGNNRYTKTIFNSIFLVCIVIGCATQLKTILDFSDAAIFSMAMVNILALIVLAPGVKRDLAVYWQGVSDRKRDLS